MMSGATPKSYIEKELRWILKGIGHIQRKVVTHREQLDDERAKKWHKWEDALQEAQIVLNALLEEKVIKKHADSEELK